MAEWPEGGRAQQRGLIGSSSSSLIGWRRAQRVGGAREADFLKGPRPKGRSMYVCMYVCVHMCTYGCACVFLCRYVCVCMYVYVWMYVCIYMFMCIYMCV